MAFGDFLEIKQFSPNTPISLGYGITLNKKQVVASTKRAFQQPAKIGFFDIDTNLEYTGDIIIETELGSIQYESSEDVYWGLGGRKQAGSNRTESYVFKVSPSGSTLLSFNVQSSIPVADRVDPANWDNQGAVGISLSADGTEVLLSYTNSFRIYRFSKTGTYIGYFDATVDGKRINGISTDGTNLWFLTLDATTGGVINGIILSKRDSMGNILESAELIFPLEASGLLGEIEFDAINYAPKCVIWIKAYLIDSGNDGEAGYVVEASCPNQCQAPPVINATNQCLEQGDAFDPLANVTATDCNGSNIPLTNTNVTFNNVNTEVPGVYTVTYEVTSPSNSLSTKVSVNVTVVETGPRYQAISDLIESVALAQTALSHILNAEGEKIQYIVANATTTDEVLAVNQSVTCMVQSITKLETILQSKLALFEGSLCNACSLEK